MQVLASTLPITRKAVINGHDPPDRPDFASGRRGPVVAAQSQLGLRTERNPGPLVGGPVGVAVAQHGSVGLLERRPGHDGSVAGRWRLKRGRGQTPRPRSFPATVKGANNSQPPIKPPAPRL